MEKKKKKPRLKTKLQKLGIIASLVAILVSSVLCIPSSAVVDYDDFIGQYEVIQDNIEYSSNTSTFTLIGTYHFSFTKSNQTDEFDFTHIIIKFNDDLSISSVRFQNDTNDLFCQLWNDGTKFYLTRRFSSVTSTNAVEPYEAEIEVTISDVTSVTSFGDYDAYYLFRLVFNDNTPPPIPPEPTTIIDDILKPFTEVGAWIATFVTALLGIFYNVELGSLTFCGVLSIAVLGFAVMFLLIRVIENFTHFRS